MGIKDQRKKETLTKLNRRTSWAPFWAVIRKYGQGKRIHASALTKQKRSWRRTKLKVKPRKIRKWHYG